MTDPIILGYLARLVVVSYAVMTLYAAAMAARAVWTWWRPAAPCRRCSDATSSSAAIALAVAPPGVLVGTALRQAALIHGRKHSLHGSAMCRLPPRGE
jgi:hypothetical protein